jgi:hypothetical protein
MGRADGTHGDVRLSNTGLKSGAWSLAIFVGKKWPM